MVGLGTSRMTSLTTSRFTFWIIMGGNGVFFKVHVGQVLLTIGQPEGS